MSSSLHLYRLQLPDAGDAPALAAAVERLDEDRERTPSLRSPNTKRFGAG